MLYHIEKSDSTIRQIATACFPDYKGKKFRVSTDIPHKLDSYWDSGSKYFYAFYSLDNGKVYTVEDNSPVCRLSKPNYLDKLPERILLVCRAYICGRDNGITIYANPGDFNLMLPSSDEEISMNEAIVLNFTAAYKSSYGGVSNLRFVEAHRKHHISLNDWNAAKDLCIQKQYLTKTGAITAKGKNIIQNKRIEV